MIRTRSAGSTIIVDSLANNTHSVEFVLQSLEELNGSYLEIEDILYADGLCGNLQVPPKERPCTPPLHLHLHQTEIFTVVKGHLGYQLGDEVYTCDAQTCPKPLVVPPGVSHTFWMADNKEDLVVRILVEKLTPYSGMRRAFFENFVGVFRDQQASILQIFVFFDDAYTYPASLPLPLARTIVKIGAWIGRLLGYQREYEEYTTITAASN